MRETCNGNCNKCMYWDCAKYSDYYIKCEDCKCKIACYNFSDYWDRIYASGDEEKINSLWNGKWRDDYRGGKI